MGRPKKEVTLTTTGIRISPELKRAIKSSGLQVSKVARELLEEYMEENSKKES